MAIRAFLRTFFVLTFLSLADAKAGPGILDSLIKVALKDNAGLMAAQSRYQAMRSEAGAAGALPDPSFTISAMNLPQTTLSLVEMDMSGISLGASQTIPWPGTLFAKSRMARLSAEVELADAKSLKNSLIRQIKHYYNEYSYWSFAENLINENIKLSEQVIDYIETRFSNGTGSMEEVIAARISKNEMENMQLDVQAEKRAALYMVKKFVNDSSSTDTSLTPFMTFTLDEIPTAVPDYSNNPMLTGAATKYEVARARHSLAKSEYWPEFMIGADYLIRQYDSVTALSGHIAFPGEDMWSFHFGFTLPLWFFSKQKKMTAATKYEMGAARSEEESLNIELKQSIRETQS
ncbi:MAG: TolC family protein, partial [Candidatus Zixiibacteriota bacterium]